MTRLACACVLRAERGREGDKDRDRDKERESARAQERHRETRVRERQRRRKREPKQRPRELLSTRHGQDMGVVRTCCSQQPSSTMASRRCSVDTSGDVLRVNTVSCNMVTLLLYSAYRSLAIVPRSLAIVSQQVSWEFDKGEVLSRDYSSLPRNRNRANRNHLDIQPLSSSEK